MCKVFVGNKARFPCLRCDLVWDLSCCQNEVKALSEEKASLKQHLDSSNSTVAILQDEKSKLQQEVAESKKEQDDLLVLLADQDQKLSALKNKLKDLGVPVSKTMFQVSSQVQGWPEQSGYDSPLSNTSGEASFYKCRAVGSTRVAF